MAGVLVNIPIECRFKKRRGRYDEFAEENFWI